MSYRTSAHTVDALRAEVDLLEPERSVAIAMVDLDSFATFNQSRGGDEGDALLSRVEARLVGAADGALVAHVRGDEFAVASPDSSPESLLVALDAVRAAIAREEPVRLSGGVAGRPTHGASVDELFAAADSGLVRSKRDGGDRISIAVEQRMVMKSSYYAPAHLHRLAKLARRTGRPEASLLREALEDLLEKHADT